MFKNLRIKFLLYVACGICLAFAPASKTLAEEGTELYQVAQKAFEDGFYDVAIRYLDQLLKENPQSPKRVQSILLLGQCYFFQNQYLKAYEKFQSLLPYSEQKDATLFWLGETYLKGSDFKQAEQQYKQVIELFPDSVYAPQSYYSLGWVYFEQGRHKDARDTFLKFTKLFPAHQLLEDATFKIAESEYRLKNYENAISYFKNFILKFPQSNQHSQAYFYIGESYYYLDDPLTAISYYAKAADISYDNKLTVMAKVSMGWCYISLEKYPLAETNFDEALKLAQEKGIVTDDIYLGRATLFMQMGDHQKAFDSYQKLIDEFPNTIRKGEALLGKANAAYQLKQYSEAINDYQEIIALVANNPQQAQLNEKAYFGLGWSYIKSGDVDSGIKRFETIRDKSENKIVKLNATTQIADAYQDAGKFQNAIDTYDKIMREFPDNPDMDYIQYRQGIALLKLDRMEAARLSFQTLKQNFPYSKYLHDADYYLAVAYFKKEDWANARKYSESFSAAITSPREFDAEALYILALSDFNLRDYENSIQAFQKIIKNYPQKTTLIRNSEINIAKCYFEKKDTAEAIKRFQSLIIKFPQSQVGEEALVWLGDYYLTNNNYFKAVGYYQDFINTYPGSDKLPLVYYELGESYKALEQFDKAIEALSKIDNSLNPEISAKAKLVIADIFARSFDQESAIKTYQNIISSIPSFQQEASMKLAEIYKNDRRFPEALETYKNALAADTNSDRVNKVGIQFAVADTYELMGESNKAIEEYLKIPYLYPGETSWIVKAYLRTARVFENEEKWEDAKTAYNKVISYQTDEAKFALERLEAIKDLTNKDP